MPNDKGWGQHQRSVLLGLEGARGTQLSYTSFLTGEVKNVSCFKPPNLGGNLLPNNRCLIPHHSVGRLVLDSGMESI